MKTLVDPSFHGHPLRPSTIAAPLRVFTIKSTTSPSLYSSKLIIVRALLVTTTRHHQLLPLFAIQAQTSDCWSKASSHAASSAPRPTALTSLKIACPCPSPPPQHQELRRPSSRHKPPVSHMPAAGCMSTAQYVSCALPRDLISNMHAAACVAAPRLPGCHTGP